MARTIANLRFNEFGMRSLKLPRVQDGAGDPVCLLRGFRAFAEQRSLVCGRGIGAVVATGAGRGEEQVADASRVVDDEVLRDETAHRSAEHCGRRASGSVEHRNHVERHRSERRVAAALGLTDPARIECDHPVMLGEPRNELVERGSARSKARDQQQRVAAAVDDDGQAGAVCCPRDETFLGHVSTIPGHECRTMQAAVPRFFVDTDQVAGGRATLLGQDASHLSRALRASVGETIVIVEAGTTEHGLRLDEVTPSRVSGSIVWSRPAGGEPRLAVHVLQAVPAQAMDATVEALTEAGAATIRPVLTHRSVSRPDPSRVIHRLERWRTIAREAAQLAGRAAPPDVRDILPLREALQALPRNTRIIACVISPDATPISSAVHAQTADIGLVIGPEGGLDAADLSTLDECSAIRVHLGSRTFPSRLAGAIATSLLLAAAGDLDATAAPPPS
jgi:16S rRNA (uracil1498-N3)-methyltransferase